MGSMGAPISEGLKFSDAKTIPLILLNAMDKATEKQEILAGNMMEEKDIF